MPKRVVVRSAPPSRRANLRLLVDADHYDVLVAREIPSECSRPIDSCYA